MLGGFQSIYLRNLLLPDQATWPRLPHLNLHFEIDGVLATHSLWTVLVEDSGSYRSVGAAGEFRAEIIQGCGIDASRFSVVGFGLGLERLAMIRYGISDIRTIQPAI